MYRMGVLIICLLLLATIYASQSAEDLNQFQEIYPDGSYEYGYEAGNTFAQEEGRARSISDEDADLIVQGSFLYTDPEDNQVHLSYVADQDGFRPKGDHLPTPPPIPPLIQKALDWIAAHPSDTDR